MYAERIKKLNDIKKSKGNCVVYVMSRDQRVNDNHALISAQKVAVQNNLPLVVAFILYPSVKNRLFQQYEFMLTGLRELEENLKTYNIEFIVLSGYLQNKLTELEKELNPLAIFFDFSPLRGPVQSKLKFASNTKTPCYVVDTHNIVPVWEASNKEEIGARTLRKKIVSKLEQYLAETAKINSQTPISNIHMKNDWELLRKSITVPKVENYEIAFKSGEQAASVALNNFINNKLANYSALRNDPTNNHLSDLSPYFHFGQLSTLRVALEIKIKFPNEFNFFMDKSLGKFKGEGTKLENDIASFLEEMIVRKELSDNFCFYNSNYDSIKGAKEWAQITLKEHEKDVRNYLYTYEELEGALTHDSAWNAAQKQMTSTGKMHGYMRMYWAKKILEWTPNAETALSYAIKLNDKYELDGYDPNGYVGCMWSVAGTHDRAWPERKIFGKIRYMNYEGLKRKFDIDKYIEKWSNIKN